MLIPGVLIVAAPTTAEIRADSIDTQPRGLNDFFYASAGKAALLLNKCDFNLLSFEHKWYEHGFARAIFISRQPRQAVSPVHEFVDREQQILILDGMKAWQESHVEQAESWQAIFFQQPLVSELIMKLLNLRGLHLAPIRCEFPVGFSAHSHQLLVGCRCQ